MDSSDSIKARINEARPSLKMAAPLTYAICIGFAALNIIIGLGMAFLYNANPPLSVAAILPYGAWGVIFITLGVLIAYGLIKNNWNLTKKVQLVCLAVKAFWGAALLIRCIEAPQTILITAIWLFIAYLQSVTYIHFVPNTPLADRVNKGDEADA